MAELDLLTEIHGDVKYIKQTLEQHIAEDKNIEKDYLKPLWEKHQQQQGVAKFVSILYVFIGGAITGAFDWYLTFSGKK